MRALHWISPCYGEASWSLRNNWTSDTRGITVCFTIESTWTALNFSLEISQRNSLTSNEKCPGSQESKSFLDNTTTHISESEYMLYMYHVARSFRKEAVSDRFRKWAANKWNSSLQNTWPINRITNVDQMRVFLINKGKDPGRLPSTSGALKTSPLSAFNYMVKCYSSIPRAHCYGNLCMIARPLQQSSETKAVAVRTNT